MAMSITTHYFNSRTNSIFKNGFAALFQLFLPLFILLLPVRAYAVPEINAGLMKAIGSTSTAQGQMTPAFMTAQVREKCQVDPTLCNGDLSEENVSAIGTALHEMRTAEMATNTATTAESSGDLAGMAGMAAMTLPALAPMVMGGEKAAIAAEKGIVAHEAGQTASHHGPQNSAEVLGVPGGGGHAGHSEHGTPPNLGGPGTQVASAPNTGTQHPPGFEEPSTKGDIHGVDGD